VDNEPTTTPDRWERTGGGNVALLDPPLSKEKTLRERLPDSPPTSATAVTTGVLTVAMPAYNEKNTLREILAEVLAVDIPMEVLIVDDGSTDGTREILRNEIDGKYPNVRVLYHEQNQGKGAAICTAIRHATGDYLVVQDADLEYNPQDYKRLLEPLLSGEADVVYGSRFMGSIEKMQLPNWLANKILTTTANLLYPGSRITDEATCYKMFRTNLLKTIPLHSRRFDFCPEVTAKVLKRGHRIHEIPIDYVARSITQGKKIRWTDAFDAFWTLVKYRFTE